MMLGYKGMGGHKNAAVCTSRRETSGDTTLSTPWSWTSSVQNWERTISGWLSLWYFWGPPLSFNMFFRSGVPREGSPQGQVGCMRLPGDSRPSTNAHPPRFSRSQPAPVDHFLQITAAKDPHPPLFLAPTFFTSLLDCEGQNLENRARPVLKPSWM